MVTAVTSQPAVPDLADLAHAYGVATEYYSQDGELVHVDPSVVADVLRALGADPSSDESIARSLETHRLRDWRRTLPPVFVTVAGVEGSLWVHVVHGDPVHVDVVCEDGSIRALHQVHHVVDPRDVDGEWIGEARFAVPADLPLGWHTVRAHLRERVEQSPLVVTPRYLQPPALRAQERMWGFMTQLYSMRSRRSWGIGDLADLTDLAAWSAQSLGADFTLVNPLHAPAPQEPMSPSPYLPSTRRFTNPLYLRVEEIAEFAYLAPRQVKVIRKLARTVRRIDDDLLDRDASWRAKRAALEIVRSVPLTPGRLAARDTFIASQGAGLVDACTWAAIAEVHGARWRDWSVDLQHPRSAAVAQWRDHHADDVERHLWMQWLLDEQLHRAQSQSQRAGMAIGIIHDLAVGAAFDGADAWALQDVLAEGVSVGAPPDMYNQRGQDWAQPPWRPDALADAGFIPYRDMLRTLLRNAGGVRIDHVLGLFRMWWIPRGRSPHEGTYVAFDHEALIGILALEAHRVGAVVIGEDLGTVEDWVADVLRDRGILGTSIGWFERSEDGRLRRPEQWRRDVLASVTVHDLPPTAGYLAGEHIRLRDELDLLSRSRDEEIAASIEEFGEWHALLVEQGLLDNQVAIPAAGQPMDEDTVRAWVLALHALVARSPARLIGVALPDIVGDRRAQNQPGTDQEYPNWRIPLGDGTGRSVVLEDVAAAPLLRPVVEIVDGAVSPHRVGAVD